MPQATPKHDSDSSETDRYKISIQALSTRTKNLISALLNPRKIFLTDGRLPRDWYGLAHLVKIESKFIPHLENSADPTQQILNDWHEKDKINSTIKNLLVYLEKMDRFDIISDIEKLLDEDIYTFEENNKEVEQIKADAHFGEEFEDLITHDDLKRAQLGLKPQKYDAFVLYESDAVDFVVQIIDKLENDYKLKLCIKDRDLLPGVLEHQSVVDLIAERCNRLVLVISPEFLKNNSNKFFYSFAQSLGIEQRRRKIIPCLYSSCELPTALRFYVPVNYQRRGLGNFWEKLRDGIKPSNCSQQRRSINHRIAVQEKSAILANKETNSSLRDEEEKIGSTTKISISENPSDQSSVSQSEKTQQGNIIASTEIRAPSENNKNNTNSCNIQTTTINADDTQNIYRAVIPNGETTVLLQRKENKLVSIVCLENNRNERYLNTSLDTVPTKNKKIGKNTPRNKKKGFWKQNNKKKSILNILRRIFSRKTRSSQNIYTEIQAK